MARNLSDLKVPADFPDYSSSEVERSRYRPLVKLKAIRARLMKNAMSTGP
jgi:hypothetical protein